MPLAHGTLSFPCSGRAPSDRGLASAGCSIASSRLHDECKGVGAYRAMPHAANWRCCEYRQRTPGHVAACAIDAAWTSRRRTLTLVHVKSWVFGLG
eukprot:3280166-Prymnesium_polylepis.1